MNENGLIKDLTQTRTCEECGTIFELGDDRETLCDECREHYYVCARCGERVHEDNLCTSNNNVVFKFTTRPAAREIQED